MKFSFKINALFILSAFLSSSLFANLIKIDVDNFNPKEMEEALKTHGTIELVGKSIDELSSYAENALNTARQILSLPIEELEKVTHQNFHGFQNVKEESSKKGQTRNQIAFHFKPYKEPRMPENISDKNLKAYYEHGMTILHRLYSEISKAFNNKHKSDLNNDDQSVLTARRYFQGEIKEATGIPPHSDYGLLTLVTSDQPGLEVKEGENWIKAPFSEKRLHFYVNIGDWLLFQLGNKSFIAGMHRVPLVENERYSLALFLNPKYSEQLITPSGKEATYQQFLFSDKSPYLAK